MGMTVVGGDDGVGKCLHRQTQLEDVTQCRNLMTGRAVLLCIKGVDKKASMSTFPNRVG